MCTGKSRPVTVHLTDIYRTLPNSRTHAGHRWLTHVILATWEAEIRRTAIQSQPRQKVHETLSQKKPITKKAQGIGPKFQPQCQNNNNNKNSTHSSHCNGTFSRIDHK
jgi:hypothetical protein